MSTTTKKKKEQQSFCVISGGTGCNAICGAFNSPQLTSFIIPISDDGGSSSEIQRVLGGPAIGDIRSRLVRLMPVIDDDNDNDDDSGDDSEQRLGLAQGSGKAALKAIKKLLEYRLDASTGSGARGAVKKEWHSIVEGRHKLWKGIPVDRKECIRAFLVHLEAAILKKAQRGFNWNRASVGNLFLAGASLFLGSLPSAIFLFASITEIPHEQFQVVPVINTSSTATIAAELENGTIIVGQSEISHPSPLPISLRPSTPAPSTPTRPHLRPPPLQLPRATPTSAFPLLHPLLHLPPPGRASTPSLLEPPQMGDEDNGGTSTVGDDSDEEEEREEENSRSRNVIFSKDEEVALESRIKRIYYLNPYGTEIHPRPNPLFVDSLNTSSCLVYSCGSLYTSIIPCLGLRSIGRTISDSPSLKYKILLLNSKLDRETGGYTAVDFVAAIVDALTEVEGGQDLHQVMEGVPVQQQNFITHLIYAESGQVEVDLQKLRRMGITCVQVRTKDPRGLFDEDAVKDAFERIFA